MSRKEGHLANVEVQKKLADIDRELRAWELADLEHVLRSEPGRRFYYRMVFELCCLEGNTFDSGIRDGACLGMHMARKEGMRDVGRTLMLEAQRHFPELWRSALNERLVKAELAASHREDTIKKRKVDHDD